MSILAELARKVVVENIEPSDRGMGMFNMLEEHLARYNFASSLWRGGWVLNLASARGYGSDILTRNGAQVVGLEINRKYLRKEKKIYPNAVSTQANATHIPFPGDSFGMVAAFELIEHVPKDEQQSLIDESTRVLDSGGLLVLSFPERYSFGTKSGRRQGLFSNPYHLYEPKVEEVEMMIKGAGLTIESEYGQMPRQRRFLESARKISTILPVWPFWAWGVGQDTSVLDLKNMGKDVVPLTHLIVARKI